MAIQFVFNPLSGQFDMINTGTGGTPGGANTEVQFNDSGSFGADAKFYWNNTTKILYLGAEADTGQIYGPNATTTNFNGGQLFFNGGIGDGTGTGGNILLRPGVGGATGNGGYVSIISGNSGGAGNGGVLELSSGNGGAVSGDGGLVRIVSGTGNGSGSGGNIEILAGGNIATGTPGNIIIGAGD